VSEGVNSGGKTRGQIMIVGDVKGGEKKGGKSLSTTTKGGLPTATAWWDTSYEMLGAKIG